MNDGKYSPGNTVRCEKVTKETRYIAQLVGFVSVDRLVVFHKRFLETVGPHTVEFTESFADKTVEIRICAFLGTTLDNHVAQLDLGGSVVVQVISFTSAL